MLYIFGGLDTQGIIYGDLHRFNPASATWTELPNNGQAPSSRCLLGFTATPDGMLYVFGGGGEGEVGK